jgi:Leucine-rich repeat (LRR) protein
MSSSSSSSSSAAAAEATATAAAAAEAEAATSSSSSPSTTLLTPLPPDHPARLLAPIPGAGVTPQLTIETIPLDWQAFIISFLDWRSHFVLSRVNKNLQAACRFRMSWGGGRRVVSVDVGKLKSRERLVRVCDGLRSAVFGLRTVPVALDVGGVHDFNRECENDWLTVAATVPSLRHLIVEACPLISDAGLAHVASLSQLQLLNLSLCEITDAGLAHVSSLTQLQSLNLSDCSLMTVAGLAHVSTLSQLQSLNLSRCRLITDAGLAHLQTALPTLAIHRGY